MRNRKLTIFAQTPDPLARLDRILKKRDQRAFQRLLSALSPEEMSDILTALSPRQMKVFWSMIPLAREDEFLPVPPSKDPRVE